eukprot:Em0016g721a
MRRELGSKEDSPDGCSSYINITAEKLKDLQEQDETLAVRGHLAASLWISSAHCPESSWDKYILVLCDYATRYPEAVPPKSLTRKCSGRAIKTCRTMRKRKRVFHVNVLKDFHIREAGQGCLAEEVQEGEDEIDIPPWRGDNSGKKFDLTMGEELVSNQKGGTQGVAGGEEVECCYQVDTYLMPRIEELINRVGRAKFITTLDLNRVYWQIPVSTKDRRQTGFATPFGTFQFNVMPFGLSGAPATFQRLMDRLLRGCEDFAVAISSDEWKDHINHLQEVLNPIGEVLVSP